MSKPFDIEQRWPELFEQLDDVQRRAVVQSLAAAWHEGWEPNREDVENLTDKSRGAIDAAEYRRRAHAAARRRVTGPACGAVASPGAGTPLRESVARHP